MGFNYLMYDLDNIRNRTSMVRFRGCQILTFRCGMTCRNGTFQIGKGAIHKGYPIFWAFFDMPSYNYLVTPIVKNILNKEPSINDVTLEGKGGG